MATVITWDEVSGEAQSQNVELDRTAGPESWNAAIAKAIGDDLEDCPWEIVSTADVGEDFTLMVLRGDRGHLATNQIVWD